jgi:predicted membrane channel-forming protein YqfA (hemolysin III family)
MHTHTIVEPLYQRHPDAHTNIIEIFQQTQTSVTEISSIFHILKYSSKHMDWFNRHISNALHMACGSYTSENHKSYTPSGLLLLMLLSSKLS